VREHEAALDELWHLLMFAPRADDHERILDITLLGTLDGS